MNNQETILPEVFTPKERDENEKRKSRLIELLESGEAMLLVGAGSSARLSYVTWDGLLTNLESLAIQCGDFEKNEEKRTAKPLEYAEDIKSYIKEKRNDDLGIYYDRLSEIFESKPQRSDDFHRLLVNLPVRGILTTNYDTVLEDALSAKKLEAQLNREESTKVDEQPLVIGQDAPRYIHQFLLARYNDPHLPQRIAHLHGIYKYPDKIILSSNDYIETYGLYVQEGSKTEGSNQENIKEVWTLHRKILWAVLATRRVIFVGFSMDDPYFNKMLEIVGKDLWVWNKRIHFAIMSISSDNSRASQARLKAERIMRDYGIETLFYLDTDGKHQGLADIIHEIAEELDVPTPYESIRSDLPNASGSA
ncbi:hypothetical protein C6497_00740 [Candidatus Poribacteria bacterium]|nr:MAG: hypothetical protein C6497_00740 [Candidatus Poribacteria bacterium]